jgi:hypothetical protein
LQLLVSNFFLGKQTWGKISLTKLPLFIAASPEPNSIQSLLSMQSVRISNLGHTLQDRQLAEITAFDLAALLQPSLNQIHVGQQTIMNAIIQLSPLINKARQAISTRG